MKDINMVIGSVIVIMRFVWMCVRKIIMMMIVIKVFSVSVFVSVVIVLLMSFVWL